MKKLIFTIAIIMITATIYSQKPCPGQPTLIYQGKTYNTVQIGSQCWLKENLDVGNMLQGIQNSTNNEIIEKYCYENKPENCTKYGALYKWDEATAYSNTTNPRGICPEGWHIPSKTEFSNLKKAVHDSSFALIEKEEGIRANNTSGFSVLMAGKASRGAFSDLGTQAYLWSSIKSNEGIPSSTAFILWYICSDGFGNFTNDYALSVRCINDITSSLLLNYPNGGEDLISGRTCNIIWSGSGISNVKIEYSTNNGNNWNLINASYPASNNTYPWIIPEFVSVFCKIKITAVENPDIFDVCDLPFTILHENSFKVKTTSNPLNSGTISGEGIYNSGSIVTVKAENTPKYNFVNWTENNNVISTENNYTFTITANRNFVANFVPSWNTTDDYPIVSQKKIAVILIDYPDTKAEVRASYPTVEEIRKEIFDSTSFVQKYLTAMSYGKFKLTGDVFGPFTHQDPIIEENSFQLNSYLTIKTINIPDFDISKYTNFAFVSFNDYIHWGGCSFGKYNATITINNIVYDVPEFFRMCITKNFLERKPGGFYLNSFADINPSQILIPFDLIDRGGIYFPNYTRMTYFQRGFLHELIHTLGVWAEGYSKTNGNRYSFEDEIPENSNFLNMSYGFLMDMMGTADWGTSINGAYRDLLGWTDNNNRVKIVSYSKQRVRLYPINRKDGYRICEIRIPFKYSTRYGYKNKGYFLEVREIDKWDSSLVQPQIISSTEGILVHQTDGLVSSLIDASPSQNLKYDWGSYPDLRDAALKPGMRYADGDIYLSNVTKNNDGSFSVDVEISDPLVLPSKPILFSTSLKQDTVIFKWDETSHTVKYFIQLSKDQNFSIIEKTDSVTIDTTKIIDGLTNNTNYFWRVRGKNNAGYGPWSDVGSFKSIKVDNKNIIMSQGWSLVSLPLQTLDMNGTKIFPNAVSELFSYENGYKSNTILSKGKGYWVKHAQSVTQTISGSPFGDLTIPLNTGWNLIGPYEMGLSVNALTTTPQNILSSFFFGYENGYRIPTSLEVGKGYWVKANQAGVINIPTGSGKIIAGTESPINKNWSKITVTDAKGVMGTLYLSKEEKNAEKYELPPAPPSGIFDVRWSDHSSLAIGKLNELVINGAEYPITIKVDGTDIKVRDKVSGSIINKQLRKGESLIIANKNIERLEVEEAHIPLTYELFQNYPNPFNPVTIIKYQIPENGKVTIKIFDVLGRVVETLVDVQKEAGSYSIEWNGSKNSSGVYFYQLQTGKYNSVKKMLMMK